MNGPIRRARTGAVLAELALALLLAGAAAVIGGGVLIAMERRTRRDADAERDGQSTRDIARLLVPEIASALPESVFVRGDTALDLHAQVGVSVLCARTAGAVVLPGAITAAGIPFTFWRQQPGPADLLMAWDTTGAGRWHAVVVDSAAPAPDGAGCATSTGFRTLSDSIQRIAVMRVYHAQPLPAGVPIGAPVRVYRPVRWTLYRGADRTWSLGYRTCPRAVCGTVQPVAGPLASAADAGLRFTFTAPGVVSVGVKTLLPSGDIGAPKTIVVAVRGAPRASP